MNPFRSNWGTPPRSRATVKDAHSPSGQEFYAASTFADLPDCPHCRYGTPEKQDNGKWKCIDCGRPTPPPAVQHPPGGA